MSIAMIVFLVLSVVLLGMGIYGGSVQIPDAAAVEAGAYIAELIGKILQRKVSGVGLHLEEGT